ncbi:MAG: conjugal transfer protein TraH [Thermoplasmata archaeon]
MKKVLVIFLVFFIILMPIYSQADWVSDWFQQATGTPPGNWNTRAQSYYYGGTFSARYTPQTTNIVNLSLPSLDVGCGGISLFGGGFGFVNLQYLVQQLQQIIQMAPAMAFNLAIEAISEALHVNMNTIKSIIDRLNGLNLNACKASQALVAFTAKSLGAPTPGSYGNAVADFLQSSGVENLYDTIKTSFSAAGGNATTVADNISGGSFSNGNSSMTSGCPQQLKNIINLATPSSNGSFIDYEAQNLGLSGYSSLIRSMIGDIIVKYNSAQLPVFEYLPPNQCNNAGISSTNIDNFLNGIYYTESENGSCTQQTIIINGSQGLRAYVTSEMTNIVAHIKNGTALTPDEVNFLNNVPFNLGKMLTYNAVSGTDATFIASMTDYVAKAFAYQSIYNLYESMNALLNALESIKQTTNSGQSNGQCSVDLTNFAFQNLDTMKQNAYKLYEEAYNVFKQSGAEYQTSLALSQAQQNFQDQVVNMARQIFIKIK